METAEKKPITIYLETNPNPNSLKFVANRLLVPEGENFDFPDVESAAEAPLAQELFKHDFVKRVFYMSNFVTVTKTEDKEWIEIQAELKSLIQDYLEAEKPLLTDNYQRSVVEDEKVADDPEIHQKIKSILDEYVRPAVEQDGGAITFDSYEDGVVTVLLQGSCSGCPSSTLTLKAGIENLLKRMLPEVKAVEAVGV
ncbi:MAG: NifU family protein [Cyclobacteriaceae bacterium]